VAAPSVNTTEVVSPVLLRLRRGHEIRVRLADEVFSREPETVQRRTIGEDVSPVFVVQPRTRRAVVHEHAKTLLARPQCLLCLLAFVMSVCSASQPRMRSHRAPTARTVAVLLPIVRMVQLIDSHRQQFGLVVAGQPAGSLVHA
jgi:hypothetical protein